MSESASASIIPPRRRDKPQLSCNACRRRKVRCDRVHPCSNCSSRGMGASCVFPTVPASQETASVHGVQTPANSDQTTNSSVAVNIQTRIDHLENMVLSLIDHSTPGSRPQPFHQQPGSLQHTHLMNNSTSPQPLSPSPSDHGSITIRQARSSYVDSSHWAAVFDSIADLRNHFAQQEDASCQASDPATYPINDPPKPHILYNCTILETPASIISSMPSRPVVDRLVSRYFNVDHIAPGIVHSNQFLRQYEDFWEVPQNAPIMWIGLLFSMMCLSAQHQQTSFSFPDPSGLHSSQSSGLRDTVEIYRTKAVQCLLLGRYTTGGPHALEALILCLHSELFCLKHMEVSMSVLSGTIVRIAMHMGYHRDAKHFPNISPFAGEMRRRVWAFVVQLDYTTSTQLGLPMTINENQTDTAEPRNLYDSDFDEGTTELMQSMQETEVTPTLYILAKLRLFSVGAKVANLVTDIQTHPYTDVVSLDRQIKQAQEALPSSLKWNGLRASLNVSSEMIIKRMWLEVIGQQLILVLHRKFLDPSREEYSIGSRTACVKAAIIILDLQRLLDEESQPDGLLYQSRWRVSTGFTSDFLLATSILCYCLQTHNEQQKYQSHAHSDDLDADHIKSLLKTSHRIWAGQSVSSKEAQKAVAALKFVLRGTDGDADSPDLNSFSSDWMMPSYYDFLAFDREFVAGD